MDDGPQLDDLKALPLLKSFHLHDDTISFNDPSTTIFLWHFLAFRPLPKHPLFPSHALNAFLPIIIMKSTTFNL